MNTEAQTVEVRLSPEAAADAVVARGVTVEDLPSGTPEASRLHLSGFDAKPGQIHVGSGPDGPEFLVGLGRRGHISVATVRRATAALVRAARRAPHLATTLVADTHGLLDPGDTAAAITSAAMSARYRFETHRSTRSNDGPDVLTIVGPDELAPAVDRARTIMGGVLLARDLVNEPGGTLVPAELAQRCRTLESQGIRVVVHDHDAVEALGMGGLLGVNRGSTQPCAFVEMHYDPPNAAGPRLALVGKGITFDSGGINLKQKPSALLTMKTDMGGAAAIIGAMSTFAALGVGSPVSAYLPLTDNMPGGDATRPGDVLRMFDGTTVEVVDTDAEGRLVLGDAVAYAAAANPAAIVSVATLTYTAIHVTGLNVAPFVATDDALAEQILESSQRSNDMVWRMPRVPEYGGLLKSPVADRCNRSEAPAASAFAALFIEQFAKNVPFAHVDMSAVVATERELPDCPVGARGWGVELMIALADRFNDGRGPAGHAT